MRSSRRSAARSSPPTRISRGVSLTDFRVHDRAQPRGDARARSASASPAPRREPSAGRRSGARRPAALELARAHGLPRVRDRDSRRDRSGPSGAAPRRRHAGRGAGGDPAAGARRGGPRVLERVAATDWRRDDARPRGPGGPAPRRAGDRARRRALLQLRQLLRDRGASALGLGQARQPLKGRPENQVGSLTSTRDRFDRLFDWSLLPDGLDRGARARADGRLLRARPDGLPRPGGARRPRPPHLARRGAADDAGDRPGLPVPLERAARRDPDAGRRGLPLHHLRERLRRRDRARSRRRTTTCAACRTTSAARTGSS